MHNPNHEDLLAKWLENSLSESERQEFESLCINDEDFARRVENANAVAMMAEQFEEVPVPSWDRESTFTAPERPRWWQWQGLPMASMAMSALAMVMVVSGFRVDVADGRLSMGFSDAPDQQQIAAMMDQKITDYQQSNQALFTQYVDALNTQQQKNSAELTQYLLSSSRQERREDFAELVKFINEQRSDDQRFYARQINNLQQEISALEAGYSTVPPLVSPNLTDDE